MYPFFICPHYLFKMFYLTNLFNKYLYKNYLMLKTLNKKRMKDGGSIFQLWYKRVLRIYERLYGQ